MTASFTFDRSLTDTHDEYSSYPFRRRETSRHRQADMKLTILTKIGDIQPGSRQALVRDPANFHKAAACALTISRCAKMPAYHGKRMVVLPGNSYGYKVFHVAKENDDLREFCPGMQEVACGVVENNGEVFQAVAKP